MELDFNLWATGCEPVFGSPALTEGEYQLVSAIRAAPKVELHFHVEGAIQVSPPTEQLLAKTEQQGRSAQGHFFRAWYDAIDHLRTEKDFNQAARSVVRGFERANVVWAEVFVSPPDCERRNCQPLAFAQTLRWWVNAFDQIESKCEVSLIVDLVRFYPLSDAERWFDQLVEIRHSPGGERIIGIGLGGPQDSNPLRLYRTLFERARQEKLLCVAHAGELGSPTDVEEALFDLEVDRIGHGLGVSASPQAYYRIQQTRTPIECCPTSSVRTGACPDLRSHPVGKWVADGLPIAISTDDPALFRTELTLEFLILSRAFGWGPRTIEKLIVDAFSASRMPLDRATSFASEVHAAFACYG